MSRVSCTRKLKFDAGHRVMGHQTKCGHVHGHEYKVFVTVEAQALDGLGMVIDFSCIKEHIGGWIDDNWDHGFILHQDDTQLWKALHGVKASNGDEMKLYKMPYNPTAENMAKYLLEKVCPALLPTNVKATKIEVQETENCVAEAAL